MINYFTYEEGKLNSPYKKSVGRVNQRGYLQVKYKGKFYYAHRIIWEMHNGKIPKGMQIDHMNRDKVDNRIENLRLVSHSTNQQNKGVKGYTLRSNGSVSAYVKKDGKLISVSCDSVEEAVRIRKVLKAIYLEGAVEL